LLAKARADGIARVAPSVVASRLGIPVKDCAAAFDILQSPDPESRSLDHEGRRIERVDGGWKILNYNKYRSKRDADSRREQTREATRRWRDRAAAGEPPVSTGEQCEPKQKQKQKQSTSVVGSVVPTSSNPVEPSRALARATPVEAEVVSWSRQACDDWIARFGGTAPGGQIGKCLKPLVDRHGWAVVRRAWGRYLLQSEAQYASPARFSATFGKWAGLSPDPPGKDDVVAHNLRSAREALENPPDLAGLGAVVKSMPRG
jgi:hypothetical protein